MSDWKPLRLVVEHKSRIASGLAGELQHSVAVTAVAVEKPEHSVGSLVRTHWDRMPSETEDLHSRWGKRMSLLLGSMAVLEVSPLEYATSEGEFA